MAGPAKQIVQHLMPDDHFVHNPITGEIDVVVGAPVARAIAAGAREAVTLYDGPAKPVEITLASGANLCLGPPLAIYRGRIQRHVPFGIEAASTKRCE